MTMSDTIMAISLIGGFGICLTAIGLLFHALFPGWTSRAETRLRSRPYVSLFVGVPLGAGAFFLAVLLMQAPHPAIKIVGAGGLLAFLVFAFAGTAGLARFIGSRLPSPADLDRPWKAVVRGWVVLYLASLLPVFGWFVFLPLALLSGFGGALMSVRRPAPPPCVERPAPAEKPELVA